MYSKIIFVLATVCVVNASVLTVNVFDDDVETEIKVSPSRCNSKVCDWLCRRIKKTNGTCVEGHCKCEKSLIAEDVDDQTDLKKLLSPGDCNLRACEQLCRRLGFPGGVCVNGRCKCDNFLKTNDADDMIDPTELLSPRDFNLRACEQLCRRLGFPGGVCVNGRCKCDNFLQRNDVDDMIDPTELLSPGDCNLRACEQLCRRLGFPGGVCVNGRCKCDNFLKTDDMATEPKVEEDSVQSRACNNNRCNQICRKQKFRGGACVGANCYCNKFLSLFDDTWTDSEETVSPLSCNSIACDDQCRRNGWHSGVCINGQCKCDYFVYTEDGAVSENSFFNVQDSVSPKRCTLEACNALCRKLQLGEGICISSRCRCSNYKPTNRVVMADLDESIPLDDQFLSDNFLSTEDDVSEESLPVSELSEDQSKRGCNMQACHQLCRRLKFPGGVCVNGRCKCDNFLGTTVDAVDEYLEQARGRVCDVKKCNRTCTRRGYAGARCVDGRCQCFDKIERQDISVQNDVASDENVESNETLRTNEEEPIESAPRACNTVRCNEMCHRLRYAGGWCRFGQCQCY
ncbi:hypothetical protein PYW08_015209 [Mythimna loreyi]|uniref:Uncharacterized protein n=1 Tax=Mythimna loreyi TaxID=667449 RepID=A0ACC2QW44_9NEOP|nr:hypothetical protein PYW08_015209 [Mythimna loreyi]